jgi:5-formyltetrahydrofolate cyclo-ligase
MCDNAAITLKKQTRKRMLQQRDALSPAIRSRYSDAICRRVLGDESWRSARTVMLYCCFKSEVNIQLLVEQALHQKKHVLFPALDGNPRAIVPVPVTAARDVCEEGPYGIAQPPITSRMPAGVPIDCMIVPGIAFDRHGGRIGYGKGYYDRFIECHRTAMRIGVAFSCQVEETVAQAGHDIPMHKIVTECETILTGHA